MKCKHTQAETMAARLLKLLHKEWVTPLDALRKIGCLSLSQRCGEFRHMHRWNILGPDGKRMPAILDKWVKLPGGKRVKAYKAI
jgi:hypothetical protein